MATLELYQTESNPNPSPIGLGRGPVPQPSISRESNQNAVGETDLNFDTIYGDMVQRTNAESQQRGVNQAVQPTLTPQAQQAQQATTDAASQAVQQTTAAGSGEVMKLAENAMGMVKSAISATKDEAKAKADPSYLKRDGSEFDGDKAAAVGGMVGQGLQDVGGAVEGVAGSAMGQFEQDKVANNRRIELLERNLDQTSLYGPNSKYPFITMDMVSEINKDDYMAGVPGIDKGDRAAAVAGSTLKGVGSGISTGLAAGAAIGSAVGPWGAVIGGFIGLLAGGIGGGVKAKRMKDASDEAKAEAFRQYQTAVRRRKERKNAAYQAVSGIRAKDSAGERKARENFNTQQELETVNRGRGTMLKSMGDQTSRANTRNKKFSDYEHKALTLGR